MTPLSFDVLRRFLRRRAGLAIAVSRHDLLESRMLPVIQRLGLETIDSLAEAVMNGADPEVERAVIEAAVTSETLLFRDRTPFEQFRQLLRQLHETRAQQRHIRIWSAACSTGQEAYSLAMILDEEARLFAGWRLEIVATDISHANLETAQLGYFNQFEVQRGLPVALLLRYFTQQGDSWRVSEHLRRRISFEHFNLLDDPAKLGPFDIIFCRNILIYFDVESRKQVLERMSRTLRRGGVLALGASETVLGVTQTLVPNPDYPAFLSTAEDVPAARRRQFVLVS